MASSRARAIRHGEVRRAVADASGAATSALELERDVAAQLGRVVPFDLWCGLTIDPRTGHPTGGFHDEGLPVERLPRLLEIENGPQPDFVALRSLAGDAAAARTLDQATAGDPARSTRYRDVLEPSGIRHELRAVFRDDSGTWGAVVLMRGGDVRGFTAAEVGLLNSLSRTVAAGLRRAAVLERPEAEPAGAPGLLLCAVADTISVTHASAAAKAWLAEIDDAAADGVPHAVTALVHSTRHQSALHGPRRARMRTRAGRWLTLHAERLGDSCVSVILEPTRAGEMAALLADAYRLTAREREVAGLVVRGRTNPQIAAELYLSVYTVQDHVKAVLDKVGAAGRTELAGRLYAAQADLLR